MDFQSIQRDIKVGCFQACAALGVIYSIAIIRETAKIAIQHFSGLNFSASNRIVALSCIGGTVISLLLLDFSFFISKIGLLRNYDDIQHPPITIYSWRHFPMSLQPLNIVF